MGKVVVTEFVSLDGVMEDPGGAESYRHGGWTFEFDRGDEGNAFKLGELEASDAQLFGRVTYEGFAAAWPSREGRFADLINGLPKFVVSSSLSDPSWQNTTVLGGDLAREVPPLKERFARDILVAGSAQLVQGLLAAGLVDELRLMVFPVVLGGGKRLFADGDALDKQRFRLADSRTVGGDGVLVLVYTCREDSA
jgi:dihydrofolate reductase